MVERSCSNCSSVCKQDEPCELYIYEEHGEGYCSRCRVTMIWCPTCGGYHHEGGLDNHDHNNIWERYIDGKATPIHVERRG